MDKMVRIRLRCVNPPDVQEPARFGLQDKDRHLQTGQPQPDGSLLFAFELTAAQNAGGTPNFRGAFAHGTPADRFLYLTLENTPGEIVRRIKVKLASITWAQVEQGGVLEASVDGRGTASVPLLGEGWRVVG